jgi:calcium-translocating P-type ATPase
LPADCRLVEAYGVRVNNATITGESLPSSRDTEPCTEDDFIHSRNILLAGTSLVSGEARALVFATGAHSAFGQIARLAQETTDTLSPLQIEISRVSRLVAALSLSLGVAFFFIGRAIGLPFWSNFIFAIGIIVANVPEGLLPTVTLSLAMGSQRMAKRNALIRHLPAVEALGCTTVICTDKTGTLTRNEMSAQRLFIGGEMFEVTPAQTAALRAARPRFFEVAAWCHDLKMTHDGWLGDPMEIALVRLAGSTAAPPKRLNEIPFDSQKRRLSTVHDSPQGPVLYCKGAPEVVLARCNRVEMTAAAADLTKETAATFMAAAESMGRRGLRVLAFAWRMLPAGYDLADADNEMVLAGLVGLADPPRPEVPQALQKCRDAGIRVIMVTGDHPETALAIARETGLVRSENPAVITGTELSHLTAIQLQLALDAPEILFARVQAEQKMRIVSALRKKREIVAVTGDGVNDAPALRMADVGIAMGLSGTEVARESADMVLLDDNFASIVSAIEEGRAVFTNIRNFLTYILTSNVPEMIPYLAFVIFRIPLPLTIIQILAVDLGTDILPALGLGAEKPGPDVMNKPPRPRSDRLLNGPLLARVYLFLGPMQAVAAMAAYGFVLRQGGWSHGQAMAPMDPLYLQSTTACLAAIVVMQIANVFLCRSERRSMFSGGVFGNKLILAGIAAEIAIILLIVYTPIGNAIFGTAPLEPAVWLFILPFAMAMISLEELRKWIRRLFYPQMLLMSGTRETPSGRGRRSR